MGRDPACGGFVLAELLVALAVVAVVAGVVLAQLTPAEWAAEARVSRAMRELAAMRGILAVYYSDDGRGSYPAPDNDAANARGVAGIFQSCGVMWTGGPGGIRDPWSSPYWYDAQAADGGYQKFILVSPGPDRSVGTGDDIYCTESSSPVTGDPTRADPALGATGVASAR